MQNAERFRQYAEECRRLAKTAAPKDRAALLGIGTAWIAEETEAKRRRQIKNRLNECDAIEVLRPPVTAVLSGQLWDVASAGMIQGAWAGSTSV